MLKSWNTITMYILALLRLNITPVYGNVLKMYNSVVSGTDL